MRYSTQELIKHTPIIALAVFPLYQIAYRPIQNYFSSKMKTILDQIDLKQLKTSERQMLQNLFQKQSSGGVL